MHELWYIWVNYFWASLKGNGPEALVQTVVYAVVAVAVYPPLRHAAEREVKHLHAKMDHVIKHSADVPAFDDAKHGFVAKTDNQNQVQVDNP